MNMNQKQTIVITGASSGIGRATVELFSKRGWHVAATMRRPEDHQELSHLKGVSLYQLDVTNETSIREAFKQIVSDHGTMDVLLNNAGYGLREWRCFESRWWVDRKIKEKSRLFGSFLLVLSSIGERGDCMMCFECLYELTDT